MKWHTKLLSCLTALALTCCSGMNAPSNPNTKLTVHYYGQKEFSRGYGWNTAEELQRAVDSDTRPLIAIFSADWCKPCELLKDYIIRHGYRDKVILVDVDIPENEARWLLMSDKREIPCLVYLSDKSIKNKSIIGLIEIINFLNDTLKK